MPEKKTRKRMPEQAEARFNRYLKANVGTLSCITQHLPDQERCRLDGLIDRAIRYGWNAAVRAERNSKR
jgi:hypothetical protein